MFKVIKNFMKQLGLGFGNIAALVLVWALVVGFWNFLVQYPITTMSITAGIPALIAIYYVIKDRVDDFRRGTK